MIVGYKKNPTWKIRLSVKRNHLFWIKMKIRYKKIIHSTDVAPSILKERILRELDKPGYRILNQTQSRVEFKLNLLVPGSRLEVFKRVSGGEFDIISENKTIVFYFYYSPVSEFFLIVFATYIGITQDYNAFLFFMVFITVVFCISLIVMKSVASDMMENILNQD